MGLVFFCVIISYTGFYVIKAHHYYLKYLWDANNVKFLETTSHIATSFPHKWGKEKPLQQQQALISVYIYSFVKLQQHSLQINMHLSSHPPTHRPSSLTCTTSGTHFLSTLLHCRIPVLMNSHVLQQSIKSSEGRLSNTQSEKVYGEKWQKGKNRSQATKTMFRKVIILRPSQLMRQKATFTPFLLQLVSFLVLFLACCGLFSLPP